MFFRNYTGQCKTRGSEITTRWAPFTSFPLIVLNSAINKAQKRPFQMTGEAKMSASFVSKPAFEPLETLIKAALSTDTIRWTVLTGLTS